MKTSTHLDTQRGTSIYVPGLDRFVARTDATERALERLVRSRGPSSTVTTAAIVLAHLRGDATPSDAAMTLVDALLHDTAHRATVIAAVRALGAERAFPLLRRALRMRVNEDAVRELATAMIEVAFEGRHPARDALTLEQHLCLAALTQHPTLWAHDTAWLNDLDVGTTRDAVAAWITPAA